MEDINEKEEKALAELDELKHTGGWHKERIEILKSYASEVARRRAIAFQMHMDEVYGIGPYKEFTTKTFDEWILTQQ